MMTLQTQVLEFFSNTFKSLSYSRCMAGLRYASPQVSQPW